MAEHDTRPATLPTICTVPDDLWEMVACPIERVDPLNRRGRNRIDARKALDGMIYRMPVEPTAQ